MKLRILYTIVSIVLLNCLVYSQPYQYYTILNYVDSTDVYKETIWKILCENIKTGVTTTYINKARLDDFLIDPTGTWLMYGIDKKGLNIYHYQDTTNILIVPYNILPNSIRYSKLKNKIYVIGNNRYADSNNTKIFCAIDVPTGATEKELTLPEATWEYYSPFFSTDESKLYILIQDSIGTDYNDKTKLVEFSTITNSIIGEKELKSRGYPGAVAYNLERGRKGKGIIYSGYRPNVERYYNIYDFEKETSSAFIYSPVNADAYMLGDSCQYLALVELKKGLIEGIDPFDMPSGIVKIFDAKTAQLVKTLNYPEEKAIVFFDDYPNDIYPLGVETNGIVTKFTTDTLRVQEINNDLTAKVKAVITKVGANIQYTYTIQNEATSKQAIANLYIKDAAGSTLTAPTDWQTEKTYGYARYFTALTNKEIAIGATLAGFTSTGNTIPVFGKMFIQSKRIKTDTTDIRTNSYIAETLIGEEKPAQLDSKIFIDSLISFNNRAFTKEWIKYSWVKDNNYYQLNNAKTMINMNIPASAVVILTAFENWLDTSKSLDYLTDEGFGILKYNSIYLREILSGQ